MSELKKYRRHVGDTMNNNYYYKCSDVDALLKEKDNQWDELVEWAEIISRNPFATPTEINLCEDFINKISQIRGTG